MSVEYRSGIAVGFKLSDEEVHRIPEDIFDDLRDYEDLICLDSWGDYSDYILNVYHQWGPEEGQAVSIAQITWDPTHYAEICDLFREYFPERANEQPISYLFTEVY